MDCHSELPVRYSKIAIALRGFDDHRAIEKGGRRHGVTEKLTVDAAKARDACQLPLPGVPSSARSAA